MTEALSEEREIVLDDVPEPTFLAGSITEQLMGNSAIEPVAPEPVYEPLYLDEPRYDQGADYSTFAATPVTDRRREEPFVDETQPEEDPMESPFTEAPLEGPELEDIPLEGPAREDISLEEYVPEEPILEEPAQEPLAETSVPMDIPLADEPPGVTPTLFDTGLLETVSEPHKDTRTTTESVSYVVPSDVAVTSPVVGPPAPVFFAPMKTSQKRSFVERAGIALQKAGLEKVVSEGDYVALKVHVGEAGNSAFVSPIYVREVVKRIKELGGKPFLTDANTLYSGQRSNAVDHIACAIHNGFSYATVEAPFIVADGLKGNSWTEVTVNGKHCESVRMGLAAVEADAMVVISHVKGHGVAGFGGAIKNLGMGLGSRAAKQRMHSDVLPSVDAEKCTHCYKCIKWCPASAISVDPATRAAVIDHDICYGCGECVAACNYEAIAISWQTDPHSLQEKMIEHTAGIITGKPDKMIYLSFLTDITPECDCWSYSDAPIVPDIGLLASRDMIAIDQAAYDMVTQAVGNAGSDGAGLHAGSDKFTEVSGTDGTHAIAYGEQFGLGTRHYEIIEIG